MRLVVALCIGVALAGAGGCSSSDRPAPSLTVSEPLEPGDVPQPAAERVTGHFAVRLLSARCGVDAITGTHAEFLPLRPLCRVGVRVRSLDATFHTFVPAEQRLVMRDGVLVAQSPDATRIKRQPDAVEFGSHEAVELDLWFEPPLRDAPRAVRLSGDRDQASQGTTVQGQGPRSVDLAVEGLG